MSPFSQKLALGRRTLNWRASTEPHHWAPLFSTVASGVRQNWGATYVNGVKGCERSRPFYGSECESHCVRSLSPLCGWVTKTRNPSLSTVPFHLESKASTFVTSRRSQISAEASTHGSLFSGSTATRSFLSASVCISPNQSFKQLNPIGFVSKVLPSLCWL
ncbi:hypothetical protein Ddc_18153 [Ditylenchus destructor]|nr:hypothetical protein Ddc_18153 [Ditylenchus destructor]